MSHTLIVPGLRGRLPHHWLEWFAEREPGSRFVDQDNWLEPHLPRWSAAIGAAITASAAPVWIVAQGFGCLAAVHSAPAFSERIAGLMLVTPADPDNLGVTSLLPDGRLEVPGVLVASAHDPWLRLSSAMWLAERWGLRLERLDNPGHSGTAAGFGPWPEGLALFSQLRRAQTGMLLGPIHAAD